MKSKAMRLAIIMVLSTTMLAGCGGTGAQETDKKTDTAVTEQKQKKQEVEKDVAGKNQALGDFTTSTLAGEEVTQDIFSGQKLTMVNIWATFCGPCLREMPELGEISQEYKEKGVQVLGIVTDVVNRDGSISQDQIAVANKVVEKTKAAYSHLLPSKELTDQKLKNVTAVPETIFIDANGNQVGKSYTGAREKAAWIEIIDQLLEKV